jgi:hypothetical protein
MFDNKSLSEALEHANRSESGILGKASDPYTKDGGKDIGVASMTRQEGTGAETGKPVANIPHASEVSSEAGHKSTPMNLITDKGVKNQLENEMLKTLPSDTNVSDEVKALMEQTYEDKKTGLIKYKLTRHFAQTGNRQGGVIYIPDFNRMGGERTINITFENGTYSTNDKKIVDALQLAISRKSGAASMIQEISNAHYAQILSNERHAKKIRGIGGMVSSVHSSPATNGKSALELQKENEDLQRQLAEMKAKVSDVEKDAIKETSMFK